MFPMRYHLRYYLILIHYNNCLNGVNEKWNEIISNIVIY